MHDSWHASLATREQKIRALDRKVKGVISQAHPIARFNSTIRITFKTSDATGKALKAGTKGKQAREPSTKQKAVAAARVRPHTSSACMSPRRQAKQPRQRPAAQNKMKKVAGNTTPNCNQNQNLTNFSRPKSSSRAACHAHAAKARAKAAAAAFFQDQGESDCEEGEEDENVLFVNVESEDTSRRDTFDDQFFGAAVTPPEPEMINRAPPRRDNPLWPTPQRGRNNRNSRRSTPSQNQSQRPMTQNSSCSTQQDANPTRAAKRAVPPTPSTKPVAAYVPLLARNMPVNIPVNMPVRQRKSSWSRYPNAPEDDLPCIAPMGGGEAHGKGAAKAQHQSHHGDAAATTEYTVVPIRSSGRRPRTSLNASSFR